MVAYTKNKDCSPPLFFLKEISFLPEENAGGSSKHEEIFSRVIGELGWFTWTVFCLVSQIVFKFTNMLKWAFLII